MKSSNGWIAQILYWSVTELGLSKSEAVWKMPLQTLMLCVLENQRQFDKNGITLQDKELIDKMNEQERKAKDGK